MAWCSMACTDHGASTSTTYERSLPTEPASILLQAVRLVGGVYNNQHHSHHHTAFVIGTVAALAQGGIESSSVLQQWGTLLSIVGAGSLGASLVLIHIYVTPLKRFVQALWAVGTLGGLSIVATQVCVLRSAVLLQQQQQQQPLKSCTCYLSVQKVSLPVYVANHPESMWLVGPLFAALTGLAFKVCAWLNNSGVSQSFPHVPRCLGV